MSMMNDETFRGQVVKMDPQRSARRRATLQTEGVEECIKETRTKREE